MSEPHARPDPDEDMLFRLAALDLSAAEKVHGRLMAAEDAGEIADLGRTYQRIARSLRQTLALKAKLARDREAAARDATARPRTASGAAAIRRARDLREAVERVIWSEAEDVEAADFVEEMLETLITDQMLADGFCDEALDVHVARVCHELGLPPALAARWRDLPAAPDAGPGAPPAADEPTERRSSA